MKRIFRDVANQSLVKQVRSLCNDFVLRLIKELQNRLPENIELLENLKELSPGRC